MINYINEKYIDYYKIKEYDGKEHIEIDYQCCMLNQIKELVKDEKKNNNEKIKNIEEILLYYEPCVF